MPTDFEKKEKLVEQITQVVNEVLEQKRLESDIDKATVSVEQIREIIREEFPALSAAHNGIDDIKNI